MHTRPKLRWAVLEDKLAAKEHVLFSFFIGEVDGEVAFVANTKQLAKDACGSGVHHVLIIAIGTGHGSLQAKLWNELVAESSSANEAVSGVTDNGSAGKAVKELEVSSCACTRLASEHIGVDVLGYIVTQLVACHELGDRCAGGNF